jgi:hypothetical protein
MIKLKRDSPEHKERKKTKNAPINRYVKELILKYRESRSEHDFERVLYHTDYLVLKMVHKARGIYDFARQVELRDLYHTAIIGLHGAVNKIPDSEDPNKIPAWISSYIMLNIKKTYGYMSRENKSVNCDPEYFKRIHVNYGVSQFLMFDFRDYLKAGVITECEYKTLLMHVVDEVRTNDIARMEGVCPCSVANRIKRAVIKIKRVVKRGNIYSKGPIICNSKLEEDGK